jgi:hypothetical protein
MKCLHCNHATVKTLAAWQGSKKDLHEFLTPGDPIDEEMYYYFLEILPPAYQSDSMFAVGEPVTHRHGYPWHDLFLHVDERYIYAGTVPLDMIRANAGHIVGFYKKAA